MKVLKKVYAILELVACSPLSAGEIEKQLDLPRPTCARLLKELTDAGYLKKTSDNKKYTPGPMGYQVFTLNSCYLPIREISSEPVKKLAEYANGNAMTAILEGTYKYVLFMHNASSSIQSFIGLRHDDIYLTNTGRVSLAFASKQEKEKTIKRIGMPGKVWNNITDIKALELELGKIREKKVNELILQDEYLTLAASVHIQGKTVAIGLVYENIPDPERIEDLKCKMIETVSEIRELSKEKFILP
ncbi:MAG: hypothetical protein A2020_07950 [Lentisphaerae bacterium GWF2_45_14]|nr:MAG: hypothetical protein A2020_07950 [Lentisphaerae bacterium GWF2_45_14]